MSEQPPILIDPDGRPECCAMRMDHLHDTAHGISGTHMAGSERYWCAKCGRTIRAEEGKKLGLKFVLD